MRNHVRWALGGAVLAVLAASLLFAPATARAWAVGPGLRVGGEVSSPATYSRSQLAALPLTTIAAVQGVSLETLVDLSDPVLPSEKNAQLRVTVTVQGAFGRRVTLALGELDPNFGNHPAVVALTEGPVRLREPALVVPGDTFPARWIDDVSSIMVGVANPTPTTPAAGAVDVLFHGRQIELSAGLLSHLPARDLTVTFSAGTTSETDTEQGPPLLEVLAAAGIPIGPTTWVAAVGSDGYVAVVTPAEALVGGRPLLISLVENGTALAMPRLVVDGDVKGGRYVSLLVDLVVGEG